MRVLTDFAMVIVGIGVLTLAALSASARKNPHNPWLQKFRLPDWRTEEQRRRARRLEAITDGLKMVFAGFSVPGSYLLMTVTYSSAINPFVFGSFIAAGLLLVGIGIRSIVKSGT